MAKYSVFPRAQAQARSSLSKRLLPSTESNIMVFQTLEGLQCDLPVRAFQRHPCVRLYGPCIQEDSTEVTTHTLTHAHTHIQEDGQFTLPAGPVTELYFSFLS